MKIELINYRKMLTSVLKEEILFWDFDAFDTLKLEKVIFSKYNLPIFYFRIRVINAFVNKTP